MKNLAFLILGLICFSLAMSGCGPSKAELAEKARQDSIRTADSIAAVKKEKARQDSIKAAIKDSLEWVNFTTPDLRTFNLHGHVKSVTEVGNDYESYWTDRPCLSFTKSGKAIIKSKYTVTRDKKGRISSIYGFNYIPKYFFEYDKQGYVVEEGYGTASSGTTVDYKYDANKRIISHTSEEALKGGKGSSKITYLAFDKYGNWTKVRLKYVWKELDFYAEEEGKYRTEKNTEIVTRTITYYEREKK